ncbi:MAG: hypothetical protein MJY61_04950 [Bacteroidales bacterium]|nr:hypothetical protein [Bacteroidales bacterium]
MKAIFISYNQAYNEEMAELLARFGQRGFTRWQDVQGRGSRTGIPRMGSHAWPEMNNAILSILDDSLVNDVLAALKAKDEESPDLGLRAFVWNIETIY